MLSRRFLLGGLIAAPAVIAAGHLMPLRGIKFDPIYRIQSWPVGQDAVGPWMTFQGPLSQLEKAKHDMAEAIGAVFETPIEKVLPPAHRLYEGTDILRDMWRPLPVTGPLGALNFGVRASPEERHEWGNFIRAHSGRYESITDEEGRWCGWGAPKLIHIPTPAEYEQSTAALIERLAKVHTLGHRDADRILREAGFDLPRVRTRQQTMV